MAYLGAGEPLATGGLGQALSSPREALPSPDQMLEGILKLAGMAHRAGEVEKPYLGDPKVDASPAAAEPPGLES